MMSLAATRAVADRVLRSTSLVSQVLHSATSFLLMAGMARFAPTEVFALSSAFFLLLTLFSSLNIYLFSAAWLRSEAHREDELNALAFLLTLGLALLFAVVWCGYRTLSFGDLPFVEAPLAAAASFLYAYLFSRRRQLLLDADFLTATLMDAIRGAVIAAVALVAWYMDSYWSFPLFLGLFISGHLFALFPLWHRAGWRLQARWQIGLQPLLRMRRGDWLGVGAGWVNVLFSQAATLLAPLLIGTHQYATLRAYELFAFPVIFMAQVLDPLQMRAFRDHHAREARLPPIWLLVRPALFIGVPFALVCLLAWLSPLAAQGVKQFIAPPYRDAFHVLAWVLGVVALLSCNAPVRWYLTVVGSGGTLLRGSAVGIPVSLLALWSLTRQTPTAEAVLAAKMAYEACLFVAGVAGLHALGRRQERA